MTCCICSVVDESRSSLAARCVCISTKLSVCLSAYGLRYSEAAGRDDDGDGGALTTTVTAERPDGVTAPPAPLALEICRLVKALSGKA